MSAEPGGRIVDAHVHVWSADTDRYPLAPGFDRADLWLPSFSPKTTRSIVGPSAPCG